MIKHILLYLQGYKFIDVINAEWELSHQTLDGVDVKMTEYCAYNIYYNERVDKYKVIPKGIKCIEHSMYREVCMIIDFLNIKPDTEGVNFFNTSGDYFAQRESLMMLIDLPKVRMEIPFDMDTLPDSTTKSNLIIVKIPLEVPKSHLEELLDEGVRLSQTLENFKGSGLVPKNIDIYSQEKNMLITSEGYYLCVDKSKQSLIEEMIKKFKDGTKEEE